MKPGTRLAMCWIGLLLGAGALTGCGGNESSADASSSDESSDDDIDYSFNCNESRGELVTYKMMVDGTGRIEPGNLGRGAGFIRKLAEERGSPADVIAHTEEWRQAILARAEALRAIPPVIADGRFVEPDTTQIDRQLLESVKPHHAALREFVEKECGDAG
jgi:hypothetical protein